MPLCLIPLGVGVHVLTGLLPAEQGIFLGQVGFFLATAFTAEGDFIDGHFPEHFVVIV